MLSIKEIQIMDLFSTDFLYITFKIKDTTEDLSTYSFNLYRSEDANSGYFLIAQNMQNFAYRDYSVNVYNLAIDQYYKIEIIDSVTGEHQMSDIIGQYKGKEPDNLARTIVYNYELYLNNIVNNDVYILKRKHEGQLCPHCFDPVRKRAADAKCPVCFGTKYTGGYYPAHNIKINFSNTPAKSEEFNVSDQSESLSPIEAWTLNFPMIHINDIVVDKNNLRYIVTNVRPTYKNYFLLRQDLQMQFIPEADVAYEVPLNTL